MLEKISDTFVKQFINDLKTIVFLVKVGLVPVSVLSSIRLVIEKFEEDGNK